MHTEMFTVRTESDDQSRLLYSAESWVRLRLALETSGVVAVSTREDLAPLLSGKGVTIFVEPIPWLAQIADILEAGFGALASALSSGYQ